MPTSRTAPDGFSLAASGPCAVQSAVSKGREQPAPRAGRPGRHTSRALGPCGVPHAARAGSGIGTCAADARRSALLAVVPTARTMKEADHMQGLAAGGTLLVT